MPRRVLGVTLSLLLAVSVEADEERLARVFVDVSGSMDETARPVLGYLPEVLSLAGVRHLEIYTFAEVRDSLRPPLQEFELPDSASTASICRSPSEAERILRTAHEAYLRECAEHRSQQQHRLEIEASDQLESVRAALLAVNLDQDRPSCLNEAIHRALSQDGLNIVLTDGIVSGEGCSRDAESVKRIFPPSAANRTIVGLVMTRGEISLEPLARRVAELQESFPEAEVVPAFTLMEGRLPPESSTK